MDVEGTLGLLALGPASGIGLYWMLYRYYRNTDKSHHFERETEIKASSITGTAGDRKVDTVLGTQTTKIRDRNETEHRKRVQRV